MTAISDSDYAIEWDEQGKIVRFMQGDQVVSSVPSREGFSYLWYRGSDGTALAVIQLDGTSDREIVWPYHSRVIGGTWDADVLSQPDTQSRG